MFRTPKVVFILCFIILGSYPQASLAKEKSGLASRFSIGVGWEQLDYKEFVTDKNLESHAEISNVIIEFELLKRWDNFFCGVKGIVPVSQELSAEKWTSSDETLQMNKLEYGWSRFDVYVGYPSASFFNPYGGLRFSESKQERKHFIVDNVKITGVSKETNKSWSFIIGVKGNGNIMPRLGWQYQVESHLPLDVQITNSSLPGFDVSDTDGYTLDLKCGLVYAYTENFFLGCQIYGGRIHWDGSGWTSFNGGSAKWPKNNTDYIGGVLSANWKF